MESYGLHWFRRDLRVAGNPALQWNLKQNEGRVVGLFCFDAKFLSRPDFSVNRFQFFLETLRVLRDDLRAQGSDLLFLDVGPDEAYAKLFTALKAAKAGLPATLSWNRDYEPFSVDRDARLAKLFQSHGIAHHTEPDHCLIEPIEIYKPGDTSSFYQVFTPYSKRWLELFRTPEIQARVQRQKKGLRAKTAFRLTWKALLPKPIEAGDLMERYLKSNGAKVTVPLPPAGPLAALARLNEFKTKIEDYSESRDVPSLNGTSGMSIYFKNGSFTVAQTIAHLGLEPYGKKAKTGADKFLSELIWREFYYHILGRHPRVERESFQAKYGQLDWPNRQDWFEAWKAGLTGYPIVDAGMRQLRTTGWMHNRMRMIVASFLTKDLLVSWQWGERYFMEQLLDGDLAPNNGGWQWAASTGCDPQPYFRIFNPLLQSQRFDPDGSYLRKYLPELAHLKGKGIHAPTAAERGKYPAPIVDHSTQRDLALALYKGARG